MAINADQLLNRPSELHRRYGGRLAMQKAQQEKMVGGGPSNIVLSKKSIKGIEGIKINVIKIEDILKGSLALDKKQLDDKKKATSKKRKDDIETKLETKPNVESGGKVKLPAAPRMGILDFVKNFIGNVLLGYFAVRLIKHLPKIMPIVKFLGNAADFIIDVGGKLLNGLVTFIDIGYKAYDKTRGFIKNLGGENFAKGFDKFIGAIDTALFLTTVLAGSMAMEAMTGGGGGGPGGGKGGGPLKSGKQIYKEYDQKRAFIRKKHGDAAARIYDNEISNGKTPKQAFENLKNRYISKGRITSQRALGLGEIKGSKLFDKGFDKAPGRLATRILGRSGKKAILGVVRPLLKRLPIIGALIDFGLSVALGEDPGRAAFKAIGAALLGTVGTAIGSLAFGFGGIVGGILGSIGGDALGGALYDMFFGGKKPQQNGKVQGKAGGGITRGGKSQRGVKRTVSKGKYKRVLTPQKPSKIELKTEAFTKPENKTLKESTEELDKTKYFGPILAVSSKIMNNEEPTDRDYQNVGLGINLLIAKGIQDKQLKGGIVAKFAGGGLVDPDVLSAAETGGDISNWVAKAFRGAIETGAQKTMRLMKEMREKKDKTVDPTLEGGSEPGGGGMTKGTWGPLLDLIAGKESGGNYEAMYPSTTLPGATKLTIAEVARRATGAVGKYQQLPQYLVGRAKAAGLDVNKDLYSAENQEKIIINVNIKGRGGERWLKGEMSDENFMQGLSQEFASLPNAQGKFYYPGQRSAMTADKIKSALSKVKKGGYSQQELDMSPSGSFSMGDTASVKGGKAFPLTKGRPGVSEGQVFNGPREGRRHAGVDVVEKAPWGKDPKLPINAYAAGKVISERYNASDPYLSGLMIDHGGIQTRYLHATPSVRPGDVVKAGQPIGRLLNLGGQTHLHFEAYQGSKLLNPTSMLNAAAYAKGGRVYKKTFAMLGEKGTPEFVFDYDTTRGLDSLAPRLLDKLNRAKTKPQLARILEFYAPKPQSPDVASFPSYNEMSEASQTFIVQSSPPPPPSDDYGSGGGGGVLIASGGGRSDSFSTLYKGDG
jgi:murein DD-endopeptidase MepM/ murein hydrolase activator NlpD